MIRLIVGLGNPGPEYEHTRHNAGFWWVDAAARQLDASLAFDRSYHGVVARVNPPRVPHGPVWLLQPMTFMNLSGKSVAPLARFFKIEPSQILVVHDELDLLPGQMKLKQGGGAAGHNGLKDILAQLGSPDFWRLRLGIGHPRAMNLRQDVADFVLHPPSRDDEAAIAKSIYGALEIVPQLLDGQFERAMMKLHRAAAPSVAEPPAAH